MIRNLRETTQKNHGAGLAQDQPGAASRACCRASATSRRCRKLILTELAPLVRAQHGVFYMVEVDERRGRCCKLLSQLRLPRAQAARQQLQARRRARRPVRAREGAHPPRRRAGRLHPDQLAASARHTPLNIIVLPVLFEGQVKAVIELASFYRFSDIHLAFLDQLTESHRHRAQHHRRQHADRGAAQAVAVARRRAADAAAGADRDQQAARAAGRSRCKSSEERLQAAAGGAAADQRGAGGALAAARRCRRPRSSARTARSSWPS